jgi:3-isopropylmalate dehydratase small subunit
MKGKVWTLGRDVNTDVIAPGRYGSLPMDEKLAHVLEDLDPLFRTDFEPGGIIVAGDNFGCGSSREIAATILKEAGVCAVAASSFARIFYRNAINVALPIFEVPGIDKRFTKNQIIEIDPASGTVRNLGTGESFRASPFPPFIQEIMRTGGLIGFAGKMLAEITENEAASR